MYSTEKFTGIEPAFSQFSTDLDAETRHRIERGQRLTELLKQQQYSPYSVWQMYATLLAATEGCFDVVPLDKIKSAENSLLRELKHTCTAWTVNA